MEFFNKAKAVRLKSHHDKYLVADDDEVTVRQHRNGSSKKARWTVEFVDENSHLIRLKSCYGGYLSASHEASNFGMTGKKVLLLNVSDPKMIRMDSSIQWEPIKDGFKVKLRTRGGKFLRANGATLPFRNSVTHDVPHRTVTQDWVLWEVDVLDIFVLDDQTLENCESPSLSFSSSVPDEDHNFADSENSYSPSYGSLITGSPAPPSGPSVISSDSPRWPSVQSNRSGFSSSRQGGMEFFDKAKSVRLQSHLGKYLVADDDGETVRQSRNGSSQKARWTVEIVENRVNAIRLKSCHGLYLTATNESFLLGATGKKVRQTLPATVSDDVSVEWEPIKEGFHLKLRTNGGKFLRANGGTPPWRNSITHDIPHRTATQDWVLWGVEILDVTLMETKSMTSNISTLSSFSSLPPDDDYEGSPDTGSPSAHPMCGNEDAIDSGNSSQNEGSGMEFFRKAKTVRLKSYHDKFLLADSDQESVVQDRHGSSKHARWAVEFLEGIDNVVLLKSCYGKYLTATDDQYLLGVTGRKVIQSTPRRLDSSVQWEPVKEGFRVRLKTRYGNYLRANGGLPPWRNSVTHDIPHRHQGWILWDIQTLEKRPDSPKKVERSESLESDLSSSSFHLISPGSSILQPGNSEISTVKYEGRMIYYYVADEGGNVNDAVEGPSFHFKGQSLEELADKLEEETGLESIIVCNKNKLNGNIYPLRLGLPPNNSTMHIVVVPSTSKLAESFMPST